MKKTRVLILCPWYDPYRVPLLREVSRDFDLTVLYSMHKEIGREWQVPENLPFSVFFLKPIFLWKTKQMFGERLLIRYPAGLIRLLNAIKPDVVVGLEFRLDCIIGGLWARLTNRGYVTWSDMTAYHDMRMGTLRRANRKFMLSLSHAVIGSCSDTINHFFKNFGYLKEKSFLSILSAYIQEHVNVEKNRDLQDEQIHFLYVGELIPRKGVDLLIRAFAILLESVPNALLTLVGKGVDMESLKFLAKSLNCESSVIFKGSLPYELIPHEMVKHDIFVLPTRLDVFGLVVAEAIACGLPVICSRYAGSANDLVQYNGLVVDPENIDELVSAMKKLALNPEIRIRMIKEGELILKKNDLRSAVQGYTDAIRMAALRSTK